MEIHADFNSKSQLKIGIFLTDENEFLFSFPGLCFCIPFLYKAKKELLHTQNVINKSADK